MKKGEGFLRFRGSRFSRNISARTGFAPNKDWLALVRVSILPPRELFSGELGWLANIVADRRGCGYCCGLNSSGWRMSDE